jgi:hypothetical protein
MKTSKLALLMILLAGSADAQVSSSTSAAPDVTVIKISWRRVGRNLKLDEAPLNTNPERPLRMAVNRARINESRDSLIPPVLLSVPPITDSPAAVRTWNGFIYEFTVKNTGAKTILELVWEYSFSDPGTQRKVGRRQYKSKVKIRPGMTAKLVERSSLPPIGTIGATQAGQNSHDQSQEQMVIQSIKYADGCVWQRSPK